MVYWYACAHGLRTGPVQNATIAACDQSSRYGLIAVQLCIAAVEVITCWDLRRLFVRLHLSLLVHICWHLWALRYIGSPHWSAEGYRFVHMWWSCWLYFGAYLFIWQCLSGRVFRSAARACGRAVHIWRHAVPHCSTMIGGVFDEDESAFGALSAQARVPPPPILLLSICCSCCRVEECNTPFVIYRFSLAGFLLVLWRFFAFLASFLLVLCKFFASFLLVFFFRSFLQDLCWSSALFLVSGGLCEYQNLI